MTSYQPRSIASIAVCLLVAGRVDAGIIIETDGPQARRDPANAVSMRLFDDGASSIGGISVANNTTRPMRPRTQRSVATPDTILADDLAGGRFRLFSSSISQRAGTSTDAPLDGVPTQSAASVIADGLRHSGNTSTTDPHIDNGIQIPAVPAIDDDEIVTALFALPEPSTLSLAILGAALASAMPFRRWRKRYKN